MSSTATLSSDETALATEEGAAIRQYVSFWIGEQLFGVPVDSVQEVLSHQTIGPVPRSRREIAGLLNLRGQIVTAVDLRCRLELPPRGENSPEMNVVVYCNGEAYSLLVDEVGDVVDVSPDLLIPPPNTLDARWKDLTDHVVRLERNLLIILNIPALLKF